jgi:hypothetical protein
VAIFANGPGVQTTSVGTATSTVPVFSTSATGLTGTLTNVTIFNSGTVTAYLGGTGATSVSGLPLAAGDQILLKGPAINIYACTASLTTTLVAGLATLSTVD